VPWLLVLAHCLLLTMLLGRFRSPVFAFLYSRGYSRDVLWGHMMLASAMSILTGWLPAAIILWTGLRSVVHDHLMQSPYFPVMAQCEFAVPLIWIALYLLLTPAFHYAWIRRAQPTRDEGAGGVTAFMVVVALATAFIMGYHVSGWVAWLLGISYMAALASLVFGGRALHRGLEVRA
jgi:hypothetical protein